MKTTRRPAFAALRRGKQNLLAAALTGVLAITPARFALAAPATNDMTTEAKSPSAMQNAAPADEDAWHFSLIPLGWLAGVSGNVTVHGHQANTDVSFDEILDHLKGIAMLDLELRKSKFGFYTQPNWIKLEADGNTGPLRTTDEMQIWIVDAAGFYEIGKWGEEKPVTLDALAGVRYWNINDELTESGLLGITRFNGSHTLSLIDPLIGLRAQIYLTRKLSLRLHGDIGGFGISYDSSDFSWQALGMFGYDFSRHFSFGIGYRALSVDKDRGSGSSLEGAHIILHGAIIAFDFHW